MPPNTTLDQYLTASTAVADAWRVLPRQGGQFNVFSITDLLDTRGNRPPMSFGRRLNFNP